MKSDILMNPPKKGKKYWEIVNRGCGGHRDYFGEFDCQHPYGWSCDECPWSIEYQKEKAKIKHEKLYSNVEEV